MNLLHGHALDVLATLEPGSVQCCVTSPPYWGLRDYGTGGVDWPDGWHGELGLEPTPELYVEHLVAVFRAVRRVLRDDGTLWLNLGDCYYSGNRGGYRKDSHRWEHCPLQSKAKGSHMETVAPNRLPQVGLKDKDLVGVPWRVAFALQADGWWLRSDIIWSKPNPMPESVRDRPTRAHEYIFLLSKGARYYYDADAIAEPASPNKPWNEDTSSGGRKALLTRNDGANTGGLGQSATGTRNARSVWEITTAPFPEAHFATFPPKLPELCVKAGSAEQSCPECGAPWERIVEHGRTFESGSGRSGNPISGKSPEGIQGGGETKDVRRGPVITSRTLGWEPSCECGREDTVGSVVLDPFIGAGTVGLVAEKLGRRWIGIDANEDYLAIARRRLAQPTLWVKEEPCI